MGFRLILFFLVSNILFAQNEICGTTFYVNQSLQESPEKKIILEQLNNFTKDFIELNKNCRTADTNYVIPVVVHIIHNYGPERISALQVESVFPLALCLYIFHLKHQFLVSKLSFLP